MPDLMDDAKLFLYDEDVPAMEWRRVYQIIWAVRQRELSKYSYIDPVSRLENDVEFPEPKNVYQWRGLIDGPVTLAYALAEIAGSPRTLKKGLRRTIDHWDRLYGEVYFDHLLVVSLVRVGAPSLFGLIRNHRGELSTNSSFASERREDADRRREKMEGELRDACHSDEISVESAEAVIDYLFPRNSVTRSRVARNAFHIHPQGVSAESPVKSYWRLLLLGEVDRALVSDQDLLAEIEYWKAGGKSSLIRRMQDEPAFRQQAGYLLSESSSERVSCGLYQLLELAEIMLENMLTQNGVSAEIQPSSPVRDIQPAIRKKMRPSHSRLENDDAKYVEWIKRQISKALNVSLRMALSIEHFWMTSVMLDGIDRNYHREDVRKYVIEQVTQKITDHGTTWLVSRLDGDYPYSLYHLFRRSADDSGKHELLLWFPQISRVALSSLIVNAQHWPQVLGPQLAVMFSKTTHEFSNRGARELIASRHLMDDNTIAAFGLNEAQTQQLFDVLAMGMHSDALGPAERAWVKEIAQQARDRRSNR